jgi:apolipoprotein N-acyltransferase
VFQAINTYVDMSRKLLDQQSADVVMWPECAVPIPLRSNSAGGAYYRYMLSKLTGTALLIGTLDFTDDGSGMTNGAVLIDRNGELAGKYAKYHRVPFGEYVPFREFLPQFMIKTFDMGRDLTAGKALEPVTLNPDIRIGTAICYEGVFSYVTAALADNRANVLAALSNDVWYPRSSEPEQHLANVVMRCVETGLPMIRCSNNGGSGVVTAEGEFRQYIGTRAERPELLRETASGVVEVTIEKNPELTVFVRFGNWFIYLLAAGLFAEMYALLFRSRKRSRTHARG